ncbi:MAG TPA: hypothetical protein VK575_08985 [Gemmatimonadaceae bacterium]|nr:hypothetical protein [Gemmatimonadaceae bacterium]
MKLNRSLARILSPGVKQCVARLAPLFLLFAAVAGAQASGPTQSELAEITARGRALAEYDFASLHGTDAVVALKPPPGSITRYIARPTEKGWKVAFGRLTSARDTFFVAYEAVRSSTGGAFEGFTAVAHPTPIADTDYYVRAARGLETAAKDFGPVRRTYNTAALPRPDGNWWVYLLPAQTVWGVFPLGADARYLVSADGRTILERRRLHNSVIEFNGRRPPQPGAKMEAGTHRAVVAEIPEDTDVMHVLVRTPRIPEYVMTDRFVYRIDPDGKINFLGTH